MRKALLALACLLATCLPAAAQFGGMFPGPGTAHSTGGSSPWSLVTNTKTAGVTGGTSAAVNTTTAKLFFVTITDFGAGTALPTDSSGNTWTQVATGAALSSISFKMWYVLSPTTSASHTFTFTCAGGVTNCFGAMTVQAWTEAGTPTFDATAGSSFGSASASSVATGSITPSVNNSLVLSGAGYDGSSGTAFSVTAGMTKVNEQQLVSGTNEATADADLQQGTAAAVNPTWSASSATTFLAGIASFKP